MAQASNLTEWRLLVLEQGDGECSVCGYHRLLQAHHVKPRSAHPELTLDVSNGQVLCVFCHADAHSDCAASVAAVKAHVVFRENLKTTAQFKKINCRKSVLLQDVPLLTLLNQGKLFDCERCLRQCVGATNNRKCMQAGCHESHGPAREEHFFRNLPGFVFYCSCCGEKTLGNPILMMCPECEKQHEPKAAKVNQETDQREQRETCDAIRLVNLSYREAVSRGQPCVNPNYVARIRIC